MVIKYSISYNNNSYDLAQLAIRQSLGENIKLSHFANGKPYLIGNDKFVSISHSGKYFVLAISDVAVGIDIEKRKDRNFGKIAKKLNLALQSCDKFCFYKEWTAYEARFKLGNTDFKKVKFINIFEECELCIASEDENYIIEQI